MKTVRPKVLLQGSYQLVELAGADRVEAGSRLIQKHDLRIERQRARKRHALDHTAGKFGGIFVLHIRR